VRIVPDSLLRKRLRLDRISQAEIVSTVVTISVVVSMAVAGAGVWALVAGALALPLVQSMMIFWFVWWWPGLEVSGRRVRAILRYSLANLGVKISWMIYQGGDDFILGKLSGNVILGFYSMAKQITAFPIDKVSTVVNQLAFPVMARLQSDPEAMRSTLLRGIRMVVWTTAPMSAGIILVGRDFVHTVLTDKWAPAVPILYPLALYGLIRSVAVLFPHVLMARYRARFLFGYNIVLVVALLPAFWVGVALGGPIGAALVWISVYPFIMVWMAHEALREVGLSWKALWSELWPTLTATLIMSAAVLAIQWVLSLQGGNMPAVRLAISVLVGATAFGLAFIRLGGATRREVLEIAGWMLHRGEALRAVE
jgi:O-antigen/teichoic acid export membrane protein